MKDIFCLQEGSQILGENIFTFASLHQQKQEGNVAPWDVVIEFFLYGCMMCLETNLISAGSM